MSEVKIYTLVMGEKEILGFKHGDEHRVGEFVKYKDYAALETKCAALAAENAGLKHAMAATLEHVSVTDAGQAGVAAMIINDALHHSETPANDAFLAEVRAHGVEMAMEHMQSSGSLTFGDCYISLNEFAAELRKGGWQK